MVICIPRYVCLIKGLTWGLRRCHFFTTWIYVMCVSWCEAKNTSMLPIFIIRSWIPRFPSHNYWINKVILEQNCTESKIYMFRPLGERNLSIHHLAVDQGRLRSLYECWSRKSMGGTVILRMPKLGMLICSPSSGSQEDWMQPVWLLYRSRI